MKNYDAAGVSIVRKEQALDELAAWITRTFDFNQTRPLLPLGYFANVLQLAADLGLAISTDGVGTKILIAQQLDRYDTIGIDCVAMNANDIICVGARPVAMVDYIAVQQVDPQLLGEIAKGLYEGARTAAINIPGGEIAQIREMIHGSRTDRGFDLVGTCVGTLHPERLIIGEHIQPGDQLVGIASTGIHSNGLTLARRALFQTEGLRVSDFIAELGKTIGEELLTPTRIYVKEVLQMLDEGLAVKALIHITGEGLLNLLRVKAPTGYVIEQLLPPHPIFELIKQHGQLDDAVMFEVFNMGIGFCVIVNPKDAGRVRDIAVQHGNRAAIIGYAVNDPNRRVWLPSMGLVGQGKKFSRTSELPPACPSTQ